MMRSFLVAVAFATVAAPAAAVSRPWAEFWSSEPFGGRGEGTYLAREDTGASSRRARWIAVQVVVSGALSSEKLEYWTDSDACPGLARLAAEIDAVRRLKWRPRLQIDGRRYSLSTYKDGSPGVRTADVERGVLERRIQPILDAIAPCWVQGAPPAERNWTPPNGSF